MIALGFICWRLDEYGRTVRFLVHASLHSRNHATARGAKSFVADAEAVLTGSVGSSDHRGIQYWRRFVYQAAAITVRSGRPSGSNHVSWSCKTVSALVKREPDTLAMRRRRQNAAEFSRRFRMTSHATVHSPCGSKYDRNPGSNICNPPPAMA